MLFLQMQPQIVLLPRYFYKYNRVLQRYKLIVAWIQPVASLGFRGWGGGANILFMASAGARAYKGSGAMPPVGSKGKAPG